MNKLVIISTLMGMIATVMTGCSFENSIIQEPKLPITVEDRDIDIKDMGIEDIDAHIEDEDKEDSNMTEEAKVQKVYMIAF